MKRLLKRLLILFGPIVLIVLAIAYIDIFHVFGFKDYNKVEQITAINRGMITTKTYINYREEENFDSFIFGSSRSHAFKCKNWKNHLNKDAKPFHFDASGEGIWGILKKIEYIDEQGDSLKNALIILDRSGLKITYPRDGILFIAMPEISKGSKTKYYSEFLKASLYPKLLISYIDYSIFRKYRGYMGRFINNLEYDFIFDKKNGDLWYAYDEAIQVDSLGYYNELIDKGVFYERPIEKKRELKITDAEIEQLEDIKKIFQKHNTNYKIVLSPTYDEIPVEKEQIELLNKIFGKESVYDFSGKSEFSKQISNFYDAIHYRPHVADEIMKRIYVE